MKSRMKWAIYVAPVGKEINTYRILVGKPEGKTPLGRPKRRWEDTIKMSRVGGVFKHGNEWSGKFLHYLRKRHLRKKEFDARRLVSWLAS